jgi:hypothetical protein
MDNEKEIKKNSMYIEVENEEEILRLQQEVIKSNLPIEDVAKIVGKLQKLLELTKHNTNEKFTIDMEKNPALDWVYKPYGGLSTYPKVEINNPTTLTTTSNGVYSLSNNDDISTGTIVSSTSLPIRNDVPF